MSLSKSIRNLRITSLLLFITPIAALIGSLVFHNYLVSVKFINAGYIPMLKFEKNHSFSQKCTYENGWCEKQNFAGLDKCNKYEIDQEYFTINQEKKVSLKEINDMVNIGQEFITLFTYSNKINKRCILNYRYSLFLLKLFPGTMNKIANKEFSLGTSSSVNPFFYGESSISNIVKREPVKYIFKPMMFISVILMFFYWFYYNKIFNNLLNTNKTQLFFIFGSLSALFLFLHCYFLGDVYEGKFLNQLRKSYIIFFILFEILAQFFLIKKILNKKKILISYLKNKIILCKLFFVATVCASTLIITLILLSYDLSNKIEYILEWNYFSILIFFYFLSFLVWKKRKN